MEQEHIIIIGLLVAILVLIWWTRKEHETDTIYVNGMPIRVDKSPYGVYTSGASLRDQVQFTSTDQA
jgi:hypothetical protein